MNYPKPNCFEKKEVRWQKYFKIMVKLVQNSIRSTELSIAYSPCYSIVLMCYNGKCNRSSGFRRVELSIYTKIK